MRHRRVGRRDKVRGKPNIIDWKNWLNVVREFTVNDKLSLVMESLPNDSRPYLTVKINDTELIGLLDTGATSTIIGRGGLNFLRKLNIPIHPVTNNTVTTADGSPQTISGYVNLTVNYDSRVCQLKALVVPSLKHRLILGIDFCRLLKIKLEFSRNTITAADACDRDPALRNLQSLSSSQKLALDRVIRAYREWGDTGLGRTELVEHNIDTGDASPIKQGAHRISPYMLKHMHEELDRMLKLGVVRKSSSSWCSPALLVKKASGEYRFCFDGRKLNAVTKKDAYPLPNIASILDQLRDAKFMSSVDLKSAFWQIPLSESSCEKTAFAVPGRGLFEYVRLPFGLTNAPKALQRLMEEILGHDLAQYVFVYLDDLIIISRSFEEHVAILCELLARLKRAGLTVNTDKCEFVRSSLKYLGYVVDENGLRTDEGKIEAIANYPQPVTMTQLRRFIGMASWYRRFVLNFASIAAPLTDLLKGKLRKGKLVWNTEALNAFEQLKVALCSTPVLASPDFNLPFTIQTDASDKGLGGILTQGEGKNERVIAYASRALKSAEKHYTVTEKECLAVVFAVEKFRPYVEGVKFTVITDHHSLLWLKRLREPSGLLARWSIRLQAFDYELIHRKGTLNVVPDALSRIPVDIAALQVNSVDKWYQKMLRLVQEQPENYSSWKVENGFLYKHLNPREIPVPGIPDWKQVIPNRDRENIIKKNHDDPLAAHFGVFKTLKRVTEFFYWPGMRRDVTRYIARCNVCLANKVPPFRQPGLMGQSKKVYYPWQLLSADLIGPLPRSSHGHTFILVISDWFTKFTLVFPLRTATAAAIVNILENQVFLIYGVPQTIVCDNGSQFISSHFRDLAEKYGVQRIWYNAKYHPQTNPVERCNRVIMTAVRSYVSEHQKDWDHELYRVGHAIRSAVHEVTGFSPNFLNFGRHIPLNGKLYGKADLNLDIAARDPYADALHELPDIYRVVRKKLETAYQRNAHSYNLRRRPVEYQVGDFVWRKSHVLSDATRHFSAKLAPKYIPCVVSEKISRLVYKLTDSQGKNLGLWHVKDLKPGPEPEN